MFAAEASRAQIIRIAAVTVSSLFLKISKHVSLMLVFNEALRTVNSTIIYRTVDTFVVFDKMI
jgi:hypothetical protein